MLISDKFYRYYNDTYTPPIDMVFLGLEGNRFKIIMLNQEHIYPNTIYKLGESFDYNQNILARDILSGRLKRMEDET